MDDPADGRDELIQVCANLDDARTLARELRALAEAGSQHPQAQRLLIALEMPAVIQVPKEVVLMPAVEWLLEQPKG